MRLWLALITGAIIYLTQSLSGLEIKRSVIIRFEPDASADYYEIEWLKEKSPAALKIPEKERYIEKVTTSPIRKQLPAEYRFFRMRSVANSYYSEWGEIISLEKATEKITLKADEVVDEKIPITQTKEPSKQPQMAEKKTSTTSNDKNVNLSKDLSFYPKTELPKDDCCFRTIAINNRPQKVLVGNQLPLSEIISERPLYYSINLGEKKSYEQPLLFLTDGEYRVDVFTGIALRERKQTFKFHVDNTPPVTTPGLFQPVIHDGGQLWITGSSRIELKSEDTGTGIAVIRYRFYNNQDNPPDFREYKGEFTPLPLLAEMEKEALLEFFAEDRNGNQEKIKRVTIHIDTLAPRMQVAERAPKGYHRLLLEEKNTPVVIEITDASGKLVKKAETRDMLQFPRLPTGRYKAVLKDNFGNQRVLEFELKD